MVNVRLSYWDIDESVSVVGSIFVDGSRVNLFTVAPIFYGLSDHEAPHLALVKIFLNDESTLAHQL